MYYVYDLNLRSDHSNSFGSKSIDQNHLLVLPLVDSVSVCTSCTNEQINNMYINISLLTVPSQQEEYAHSIYSSHAVNIQNSIAL